MNRYIEVYERYLSQMSLSEILSSVEEECSELIQACSKLRRATGDGIPTVINQQDAVDSILEELSDVHLMVGKMIGRLNEEHLLELSDDALCERLNQLTEQKQVKLGKRIMGIV